MFGLSKVEKLQKKIDFLEKSITYKQKEVVYELLESSTNFKKNETSWNLLGEIKSDYTESDLTSMRIQSSNLYRQRAIARGIIRGIVNYVIGKNSSIEPESQNEKLLEYWKNWKKQNGWKQMMEEIIIRTLRDGEIFIRRFKTTSGKKYRFIDPEQICNTKGVDLCSFGIETVDGDVQIPKYYYRRYYKDGLQQLEEVIPAEEIIHRKINVDSNVKRGISFYCGVAKYIVNYEDWLDDRIQLNKIRSFFAVIGKHSGATASSTLAEEFGDSSNKNSSEVTEDSPSKTKKPFKSGSVMINKGIEWDLKNLNINASDTQADGRAILLMIAAGTNLAEFMVTGDASNANYASTLVSESPAVKSIEHWQEYFGSIFEDIYADVIQYALETMKISNYYQKAILKDGKMVMEKTDTETECNVIFPIIIHRDILDETKAMVMHRQLRIVSKDTCAIKAGYDPAHENPKIEKEEQDEQDKAIKDEGYVAAHQHEPVEEE